MNLGMFFSHLDTVVKQKDAENINKVLETVVPLGLEYVDIDGASIGVNHSVEDIKKYLDNFGVKTSSLFYFDTLDWKNNNSLSVFKENTKKQLEYCAYLGTNLFMPVPDIPIMHKDEAERNECQKVFIEYLNETASMSKEYNISTVIENFSSHANPYSKPEDFDVIFKNAPEVGYVLDTGNFWFSDVGYLETYDKYHSITKHIHIKDIVPNEDGFLKINGRNCDSSYIGGGIIDFNPLVTRLKENDYNGVLSIEINNFENMMENIIKSFTNLKEML